MKRFLISFFLLFLTFTPAKANENNYFSQIGVIHSVEYTDAYDDISQAKQQAIVKLPKGNLVEVENILSGNPYYDIKLKKGMKVILHVEETENGLTYSIENIKRSNILAWLSLLFCGLLILIGKK